MPQTTPRVITVAPLPPEKCAYALARYSRSPDSIQRSLEWVRNHDSSKFLESFYFQYGHASIADLGHVVMCFEGISELAATEIEDEQLWDGQARSSRYQDFGRSGFVVPPEFDEAQAALYDQAGRALVEAYRAVHAGMVEHFSSRWPKPAEMKEDAYRRNVAARAFDVARYLLFLGVPTGVGQVTSIRTLEKQIRRLKASRFAELRSLADEIAAACSSPPVCSLESAAAEPVAPTLAKHVDADCYRTRANADLKQWAEQNLPSRSMAEPGRVDALRPVDMAAEIVATLLYGVTDRPFRELYEYASGCGSGVRAEVIDVATQSRPRREELLREFRGGLYVFDLVIDVGAYRDLHRHRRCQQYRQEYTGSLGYETPQGIAEAGLVDRYNQAIESASLAAGSLPQPGRQYLLSFASRSRFLFKMDLAEAEYIARVRSSVKGHFSYRQVAWDIREKLAELEPELGRILEATPPWVEDPLTR
jgi:thymidylate synthase ThyX